MRDVPQGDDFRRELDAAKAELTIGEVAQALGLKGSSREGWTCPKCNTLSALKERPDHKGARCADAACAKGFDAAGLVMTARRVSVRGALDFLKQLIAARAAASAQAAGLFDD